MRLLELERVVRRFGDFVAVDDLSFSIDEGEVVGFLGANGAGKTTTLRMVLDILPPTSGSIGVFGARPGRATASQIGFLPEERGLYRGMTTLQAVLYFGRLKGLGGRAAEAAARPLISRLGLDAYADRPVERLSKGLAQKVQLATALVNAPRLLLLDEPFSGLDPVNQTMLQEEILGAARQGATVVFSTHVMEHAERLCTRLVVLADGRKVFDGDQAAAKALLPRRVRVRAKTSPADLPGVASVEQLSAAEAGWIDWQVDLSPGVAPGDLLEACVSKGVALRDFEARSATLHDVFIRLVGARRGDAA